MARSRFHAFSSVAKIEMEYDGHESLRFGHVVKGFDNCSRRFVDLRKVTRRGKLHQERMALSVRTAHRLYGRTRLRGSSLLSETLLRPLGCIVAGC